MAERHAPLAIGQFDNRITCVRRARFVERMLSVAHTCKLQDRSLFAYLTHALEANARGDPAPSLVPP